jgi:hypothetical protein
MITMVLAKINNNNNAYEQIEFESQQNYRAET